MVAFSVTDTGIGIPARQAADYLRGLPAGRRQHQPQIRRHRPGPGHQPRNRPLAGRRDPAGQARRARAARSRSTCRKPTSRSCQPRIAPCGHDRRAGAAAGLGRVEPSRPRRAITSVVDRLAGRPRQRIRPDQTRRADRGKRPGLCPLSCWTRPTNRLQGRGLHARRRSAWPWCSRSSRTRSRSTSTCPISTAGACWPA